MTREEEFRQNLERARMHLHWLLEHPEELLEIPNGAEIDLRSNQP